MQRFQQLRITRHQSYYGDAMNFQGSRKGPHNIAKTAGLYERIDFGNHRENLHAASPILSIIACVIRQTPFSVRRKRLASSTGSSPTTSPGGTRTPLSTMTFFSRADRPISTAGRMTAFSTLE